MAAQWYYVARGQRVGPVDLATVRQALATGQLSPAEMVWREGMPDWLPASAVPELLPPGGMPLGYGVMSYATPNIQYAGFWPRVGAAIIDSILCAIVGGILVGIIGGVTGMPISSPNTPPFRSVNIPVNLISTAIGWLYAALMESSEKQATIGKMALGLRVTDENGARISFGRATGRYFGKWVSSIILCIGFIMVAFTQRKQGLHDIMAGTLVVKNPHG